MTLTELLSSIKTVTRADPALEKSIVAIGHTKDLEVFHTMEAFLLYLEQEDQIQNNDVSSDEDWAQTGEKCGRSSGVHILSRSRVCRLYASAFSTTFMHSFPDSYLM